MPESRNAFKLESVGALTTGVKDRWIAEFNGEITDVDGVVGTAPTGASLIVDIQRTPAAGGAPASIYTNAANRPTAAAGATTLTGAAPDVRTFSTGDVLALNVLQVGSTVAGSDLDVSVAYVAT